MQILACSWLAVSTLLAVSALHLPEAEIQGSISFSGSLFLLE
jgi:hypothetical protein